MTTRLRKDVVNPGQKSTLVDTNLMLLQVVGLYDPLLVPKVKRTSMFSVDDFGRLVMVMSRFPSRTVTPHILAEVSNLLGQSREPLKAEFFKVFAMLISRLEEIHVPATIVCGAPHFGQFGLTDLGMIAAARSEQVVMTADTPLAAYMRSQGVEVIDFNDFRR